MSSSSYTSRSKHLTLQEVIDATHCFCPVPIKEQISWTPTNPGRRFKSCPKRDKANKCEFYGFLDPELTEEYKNVFYKLHEENKKLKEKLSYFEVNNVSKSSDPIDQVKECSKLQMQQMKEDLTFIKSKVYVYDKVLMFLSLVVMVIGIVIAISIIS